MYSCTYYFHPCQASALFATLELDDAIKWEIYAMTSNFRANISQQKSGPTFSTPLTALTCAGPPVIPRSYFVCLEILANTAASSWAERKKRKKD